MTGPGVAVGRLAHDAAVVSISASPDGLHVATGTTAGDLFIWDATTGERLIGPVRAGPSPEDLEWSDDGRFLVDRSRFRPLCLFDSATGEFVAQGVDPDASGRPFAPAGPFFHFEPVTAARSAEDWRLTAGALAVEVVGKEGSRWLPPEDVLAAWKALADRYPKDFTARAP